jgi:NTE family protein
MMKKKKIGLALGGGGARGLAHIGVLKVLRQAGIKIDFIAGTSMGALIGAVYALGLDMAEIEKEVISFDKKKAIISLFDFGKPGSSILKGDKIYRYIDALLLGKHFSETNIPFKAVATDLETGEEIILDKGKIVDAIMASISVPGIFPPVKIGSTYLIDGGVVNPTPIDVVKKMGADKIIGVDLISTKGKNFTSSPGMISTLLQSYEIIRTQAVKFKLAENNEAIMIKPKIRGAVESFKFYDIVKFIKSGEEATKEALPEILKNIK